MNKEDIRRLILMLEEICEMRNRLEEKHGYSKETKRLDTIAGKIYELINIPSERRKNHEY